MSLHMINLFCNNLHSDIKILIENENIEYPAHKLVIGVGSDVLNNMVYGNGACLPASIIVVPKYSSNEFLPVLKYLYTGDVAWNLDNYGGILEVSKYFGLTELENMFHNYVADTINFDNVLSVYARFFNVNDYVGRTAMKIIQLTLYKILESESKTIEFFQLPTEAVSQILQMDELGIKKERQLFDQMMTWAKTKEKKSLSSFLGNLVKLIRCTDIIMEDHREYEEFLNEKVNGRWKIRIIQLSNFSELSHVDQEHNWEIIHITARDKTIRLHGVSTIWSEPVYIQNNHHFNAIPGYRSKVHKNTVFDVMFENSIEVSNNATVQLKVPVCSKRFTFNDNDLDNDSFSIYAVHNGQEVRDLPIGAIFISISNNI